MSKCLDKLLLIASCLALAGCGSGLSADSPSNDGLPLYGSVGSESAYCGTLSAYGPNTELTGVAQFKAFSVTGTGLRNPILTKPIRGAEVIVKNSAGTIIQCGVTSSTGTISVRVPRTAGTYTVTVQSRANTFNASTELRASVLNNPTNMLPYSISTTVTLTGVEVSQAFTTLTAAHDSVKVEGGAFNILDQIYEANLQIRENSDCAACANNFEAAPKAQIFWTAGLSPGAYYGEPTAAISFFIRDAETSLGMASGIYMMGGVNGSVCVDTDHFDNSVIVHEYGHFLEKAYAGSDSPGGSHNGNSIIDPRLAWSEGWSNYFQAFVRESGDYKDTIGNVNCSSTSLGVELNIVNPEEDIPSTLADNRGEGVFREVSVSRNLWDVMGVLNSGTQVTGTGSNPGFSYLWEVFSGTAADRFPHTSTRFRNMGLFNVMLEDLVDNEENGSLGAFYSAMDNEVQKPGTVVAATAAPPAGFSLNHEYGRKIASSGPTCPRTIRGTSGENNQILGNDFWAYYYDGTAGTAQIRLEYSPAAAGPANRADLHLYVYPEDHASTEELPALSSLYSARAAPESGGTGLETVSLTGRPAGWYLINVYANPGTSNQTVTYQLESGVNNLCP